MGDVVFAVARTQQVVEFVVIKMRFRTGTLVQNGMQAVAGAPLVAVAGTGLAETDAGSS